MSLATLLCDTVNLWRPGSRSDTDREHEFPDVGDAPPDARRLIRDRRYGRVLSSESGMPFDKLSCALAWKALEHQMAFVPGGEVRLANDTLATHCESPELVDLVTVQSLYLDRGCVTNEDYARFVQAGGYSDAQYWPQELLPGVLQFVDASGCPGPKDWLDGNPPQDKLDHPVVGICWYEANAYATWAGKRLPLSEEWQRGGTWPQGHRSGGAELRYPWGNAFDPSKANTWAGGIGDTVAVTAFRTGDTTNGVRQLIGNVWEWVDAQYCPNGPGGTAILLDQAMAEIRGAAFDTYFHSQATCQFRTGQPLLHRGANVGFRCCISSSVLPSGHDFSIPD